MTTLANPAHGTVTDGTVDLDPADLGADDAWADRLVLGISAWVEEFHARSGHLGAVRWCTNEDCRSLLDLVEKEE